MYKVKPKKKMNNRLVAIHEKKYTEFDLSSYGHKKRLCHLIMNCCFDQRVSGFFFSSEKKGAHLYRLKIIITIEIMTEMRNDDDLLLS